MFDWESSCQQFVLSRYKKNTVKHEIVLSPSTVSNEKRPLIGTEYYRIFTGKFPGMRLGKTLGWSA